ncbi:hypothetical protein Tco_0879850 [Tanacetum coccineum]
MSTSTTHQQSLVNAGSETRPLMLERCPYVFKNFTPDDSQTPRLQTEYDLTRDDLKHYEAEIEAMNLILISIPNDIYNFVDACTTAQAMWQRVERLMRGIMQNKVDRETRFNNEFDQFAAEPEEALVAKKLEKSHDPLALVAHTGSSSRIPSPYYVTHPSLVVDYDDDYQGDAFQNNYEDLLVSAMMLLDRAIPQRFSNPTNNRLRTSSNTRNQAIMQADKVNIQSRNSGNDGRNTRHSYVQEEIIEGNNIQNDSGNTQRTLRTISSGSAANVQCYNCSEIDKAGVTLIDEQNDFLIPNATRMEEIKELSVHICLMARIQPVNINSDAGPSYNPAFLNEVQKSSNSYVNPLFAKDNQEQKYPKQAKIINDTIGDDQII